MPLINPTPEEAAQAFRDAALAEKLRREIEKVLRDNEPFVRTLDATALSEIIADATRSVQLRERENGADG